MSIVYGVAIVMLVASVLLATWRIVRGPSNVDRILASDVIVVVVVCGFAVSITAARAESALPILLVLSLVGFSGAVSVARFLVARQNKRR